MQTRVEIFTIANLFKVYMLTVSICCVVVHVQESIIRIQQVNNFVPFIVYGNISNHSCRSYSGDATLFLANKTSVDKGINQTLLSINCSSIKIYVKSINDTCENGGMNIPNSVDRKELQKLKQGIIPYVIMAIVFSSISLLLTFLTTLNQFIDILIISCKCIKDFPGSKHKLFVFFIYLFIDCMMAPFTVALATDINSECINFTPQISVFLLQPFINTVFGASQIVFIIIVLAVHPTLCLIGLCLLYDCIVMFFVSYFLPTWLLIMLTIKTVIEIMCMGYAFLLPINNSQVQGQPANTNGVLPKLHHGDQNSQNILV